MDKEIGGTNRREFLKNLGLVVIGGGLAANMVLAGCKEEKGTSTGTGQTTDSDAFSSISTGELSKQIDNTDWVTMDTRPKASYNGWQLFGESRGGHIKGAVSFPVSWTTSAGDTDLKLELDAEGITMDKTVVVYHTKAGERKLAAARLETLGYEKLYVYNDFNSWLADEELPLERLANYQKLVNVDWVNDVILGKNPPTYKGNKYIILEVSWGPPDDYDQGHIPGAIHLDTDEIESLPLWNFVSDDKLEQVYKNLGINKDTLVIVYGKSSSAAARVLIALMRAGVDDVRFLDGGWQAWADSGYQVETKTNNRVPVTDFGVKMPVHPEYVLSTDQLKEYLQQPNFVLASIRRWDEFIGKISGYNYIEPKGEIKGAVWGHHKSDLHDQEGKMRNYNQIVTMWNEWGITPDKKVAFYCGTGWRASEAWFYAYLMGWEDISLYDGGWFEWSMNPDNPVQIGDPRQTST